MLNTVLLVLILILLAGEIFHRKRLEAESPAGARPYGASPKPACSAEGPVPMVRRLLQDLDSPSRESRERAAAIIANFSWRESKKGLLALLKSGSPEGKRTAARLLLSCPHPDVLEALARYFKDEQRDFERFLASLEVDMRGTPRYRRISADAPPSSRRSKIIPLRPRSRV